MLDCMQGQRQLAEMEERVREAERERDELRKLVDEKRVSAELKQAESEEHKVGLSTHR